MWTSAKENGITDCTFYIRKIRKFVYFFLNVF